MLNNSLGTALRGLAKHPRTALLALALLSVGFSVNIVSFSLVDSVLLRPLPYREPDRLFSVWSSSPGGVRRLSVSPADFLDWQGRRLEHFEGLAAFFYTRPVLREAKASERLRGAVVSPNLFDLLGVAAARGRTLQPGDEAESGGQVAVVSSGVWSRLFGSDPAIVGKEIWIGGQAHTIVGVMPPLFQFTYPDPTDVWTPLIFTPEVAQDGESRYLSVVARLAPGSGKEQALGELASVALQLESERPETNRGLGVSLVDLHSQTFSRYRDYLLLLLGAVILVLLAVAFSVSILLLVRVTARKTEMSIRAALGASRARLSFGIFAESVFICLGAGLIGLAISYWATGLLPAFLPAEIPRVEEVPLDGRVILFSSLLSLVMGVICGLLAAAQTASLDLREALYAPASNPSPRTLSIHRWLLVVQLAVTLILTSGAARIVANYRSLLNAQKGFETDGIFLATLNPRSKYPQKSQWRQWYEELGERFRSLPGIEQVALSNSPPLAGPAIISRFRPQDEGQTEMDQAPTALCVAVDGSYFDLFGIRLMQGRLFGYIDGPAAMPVAVISRDLAEKFFPQGAVDRSLKLQEGDSEVSRQIVGVVENVLHRDLAGDPEPIIYVPFAQNPWPGMTLLLRSKADSPNTIGMVRRTLFERDPDLPAGEIERFSALLESRYAKPRFAAITLGVYGFAVFLLALGGVFGVSSYALRTRTREMAVRLALGARPVDLLAEQLRRGLAVAFLGIAIGLPGAWASTRFLSSLLVGLESSVWTTDLLACLLLAAATPTAFLLGALRAIRIDPAVSLRAN